MTDPTEAEFDAMWEKIRARLDAEQGEGAAEDLAKRGLKLFGPALGFTTSDSEMAESIQYFLARMLIREDQKGPQGYRTAAQIAHICLGDAELAPKAAALLQPAHERGDVEIVQIDGLNHYRSTLSMDDARKLHPDCQP